MQLPFDIMRGEFIDPGAHAPMLAAILVIVCVVGIGCILSERKKARGHWADKTGLK